MRPVEKKKLIIEWVYYIIIAHRRLEQLIKHLVRLFIGIPRPFGVRKSRLLDRRIELMIFELSANTISWTETINYAQH